MQKAPLVHELNPAVPERLAKIVQKMMAKHPENRFQTAAELRRYLEPLAERKPIGFDFVAILAARAAAAERRLAAESFVRGDSRASSTSKLSIHKSPTANLPNGDRLADK